MIIGLCACAIFALNIANSEMRNLPNAKVCSAETWEKQQLILLNYCGTVH